MAYWGSSDKLETYEGVIAGVQGTTTDGSGIKYGDATTIKYQVFAYMPDGAQKLNFAAPSQARSNGKIVAAKVGDPCKVFVQQGVLKFQVVEASYFIECS